MKAGFDTRPVRGRSSLFALILLVGAFLVSSCGDGPGAPASPSVQKRMFSISVNPRPEPPPQSQDFIDAFNLAYNAGVRAQYLFYTWSSLEPQAGVYNFRDLDDAIPQLLSFGYEQFLLNIAVVNTIPKETPRDLLGVAFNSSQMKQRFHALLDALRPHLNQRFVYLSVGNEVDGYLATDAAAWQAYKDFYEDALRYIHQTMPWIKVGVTVMYGGAVGSAAGNITTLTSSSDVYILTYYPPTQGAGSPPQAPRTDFPRMVALASGRPVILQEVGYASSPVLSSSEADQAQFVSNVFDAWQTQGATIAFLNYFLLHDFTDEVVNYLFEYYGLPPDPGFFAFLRTLGLRQVDGTAKPAWQALVDGAARTHLPE